jgi:integrase
MNKIEEFLLNYHAKSTINTYRCFLKRFFVGIDSDPDTYFNENRNYEADVKQFHHDLIDNPPKTIYTALTVVRVFLSENDIELPTKFWRGIRNRTKGSRAVTDDRVPSNLELKKILSHADVRARAFFLTLASSGMRIGEACLIKINDVDLDSNPSTIHMRAEYTKSGNKRICFLSDEARDAINAWLIHRDRYLITACRRSKAFEGYHKRKEKKSPNDNRLFPFSKGTATDVWNRLLKNAEFGDVDERTKVHKMHPHTLRKFFRTRLSLKVPLDVVEALMGHEGYLTAAYRKYSPEQLGELYLSGTPDLAVFEAPADLTDVQEQLTEKETRIKELEQQIEKINRKLDEGVVAYLFEEMQKLKKEK